jgi:hypothetical protein
MILGSHHSNAVVYNRLNMQYCLCDKNEELSQRRHAFCFSGSAWERGPASMRLGSDPEGSGRRPWPGTYVMILELFSPEKNGEKIAHFYSK